MTENSRAQMIEKIKNMPLDELNELVRKAAEESGMTFEEVISTDWEEFFKEMRKGIVIND